MNFLIDIPLSDKIKLLRREEGLSQRAFCDLIDIPQTTLASFEAGKVKSISADILMTIASHPRFVKYAIWLMFDQITEDQAQDAIDFLRSLPEYVEPPECD